jgi:hypothetical protein
MNYDESRVANATLALRNVGILFADARAAACTPGSASAPACRPMLGNFDIDTDPGERPFDGEFWARRSLIDPVA